MKYFKTYQLFVTLLLLGLFLGGCSPTIQTGYLRDYDKLHEGKYLQNYWSNTTLIGKKKYSTIQVERIVIDKISNQKGVTAKDSKEWLRDGLIKAARASGTPIVFESRPDRAQARKKEKGVKSFVVCWRFKSSRGREGLVLRVGKRIRPFTLYGPFDRQLVGQQRTLPLHA